MRKIPGQNAHGVKSDLLIARGIWTVLIQSGTAGRPQPIAICHRNSANTIIIKQSAIDNAPPSLSSVKS